MSLTNSQGPKCCLSQNLSGGMGKMKKWMAVFLGVSLMALLIPAGLRAQAGATGAITGTVSDQKGGAISGATIVVTNVATGHKEREVVSTGAGTFNVPSLPPSHYSLEITATGFSRLVRNNVLVQVTETASVNATLSVGQVTETLTVHDVTPPVELTSATTGETISAETASTLPLSTRNFLTLLTLSAGANTELFDSAALGRGQVTINVTGWRPTKNNFKLEGVTANDVNLPVLDNVPLPSPDTIEEFKTQTSLYDASSGRNGGGNVQVNLKSGTAHYHGDAYEFFRNNVLNANDFFFNAATPQVPRPVLRQNQYGGSFGGPVPKSKNFFFFVNYQGTREASGISAGTVLNSQIPVLPAQRDAATLAATFLPAGFSASQINPVALAYLNLPASKCPVFNDGKFCLPTVARTPGFSGQNVILRPWSHPRNFCRIPRPLSINYYGWRSPSPRNWFQCQSRRGIQYVLRSRRPVHHKGKAFAPFRSRR